MSGLKRICKMFGGMTAVGRDGKRVDYVWDYAADAPVLKEEMPPGSARHAESERAKWTRCRKCGGEMRPGIAMESTFRGSSDFPGAEVVTMSPGGPGRVVGCIKCSACGWSITQGQGQ